MSASRISWTDETWNPLVGCAHVSPGCDNCYAARESSGRLRDLPVYEGIAEDGRFTGKVRLLPERLYQPLRWSKPRRVFVNSMSDLFHPDVPDGYVAQVFAVMALAPRHTFQMLTKRAGRMASLLSAPSFASTVARAADDIVADPDSPVAQRRGGRVPATPSLWETDDAPVVRLPLPNVWLGTSVEDQKRAELRVPKLLASPAAVRFLSCEPLLGAIDLSPWLPTPSVPRSQQHTQPPGLDWIICGGESGPGARPMHPQWARDLRDRCGRAEVAFHFKQWGEWAAVNDGARGSDLRFFADTGSSDLVRDGDGDPFCTDSDYALMRRVGKKSAGRLLDGRTWTEFPR